MLLSTVCGCGAPTLDTTDEQTYRASIERLSAALPPEEQNQLAAALDVLVAEEARKAAVVEHRPEPHLLANPYRGWTAKEILANAAEAKQRQQASVQSRAPRVDPPAQLRPTANPVD